MFYTTVWWEIYERVETRSQWAPSLREALSTAGFCPKWRAEPAEQTPIAAGFGWWEAYTHSGCRILGNQLSTPAPFPGDPFQKQMRSTKRRDKPAACPHGILRNAWSWEQDALPGLWYLINYQVYNDLGHTLQSKFLAPSMGRGVLPKASGLPAPCRAARSPGHQGRLVSRRAALKTYFLENDDSHMVPNCWRSSHSRLTYSNHVSVSSVWVAEILVPLSRSRMSPGKGWWGRTHLGGGLPLGRPLLGVSNGRRAGMEVRGWDSSPGAHAPSTAAEMPPRCEGDRGESTADMCIFLLEYFVSFLRHWDELCKQTKKKQKIKKMTDFAGRY